MRSPQLFQDVSVLIKLSTVYFVIDLIKRILSPGDGELRWIHIYVVYTTEAKIRIKIIMWYHNSDILQNFEKIYK